MLRLASAGFALLLGSAASGAEPQSTVVRPLVGIGATVSDSGGGFAVQLGARFSPVLLRLIFDVGGAVAKGRGYLATSVRGDWVHSINENAALVAGVGVGSFSYGFILDGPTSRLTALTPGIGVLFGPDRLFGRLMLGLTGLVPLGPVSHPRDSGGYPISPPHVLATIVLSL